MSYILQALKKSEQERELAAKELATSVRVDGKVDEQAEAVLVENDGGRGIPLSIYGWVGGLFMVLLLVSGYMSQQQGLDHTPTPKNENVSSENVIASQPILSKPAALQVPVQEPLKKPLKQATVVEKVALPKQVVPEVAVPSKMIASTVVQTQPLNVIMPSVEVEQAPKGVQSLIPTIDITSHIYSSQAKRRSIVVNGERLVETDFITPQVQVREITHQGMIVEVAGSLVVIDRSRGWSR